LRTSRRYCPSLSGAFDRGETFAAVNEEFKAAFVYVIFQQAPNAEI
jgi:hypothetical protein